MFACHACRKHCLQTLFGETLVSSPSISRNTSLFQPTRRPYSSRITSVKQTSESREFKSQPTPKSHGNANPSRQAWLESRGITPAYKKNDRAMKKNLSYLKDPLKLADYVRQALRNGDFEGTLETVRVASKDVRCVVSWNHLIDWQLSKGKVNGAIKTYNEMKKRAQYPDAHTYTILFNGCAELRSPAMALAKVMSIYNHMIQNGPVSPNTIHMNAILKMCARAQDMPALFTVAAQLPEEGLRAANNMTYTTIINAIRTHTFNDLQDDLTPMQKIANRQKALLDVRRIWADVVSRWHKGDIWIDEELVCTMGRALLLGDENDNDDVMSLIEQTMNIPRQGPRYRSAEYPKLSPGDKRNETKASDDGNNSNQDTGVTLVGISQSVLDLKEPENCKSLYAKPGQNTLSLLMKALLELRLSGPATKYWDIITKKHGVIPDADNFHAYLRILRAARASKETIEVLQTMPNEYLGHRTFKIAMSTCNRDKNNHRVFSHAGKVLDLMQTTLEIPDLSAVQIYIDLAVYSPANGSIASPDGKDTDANFAQGQQILRALKRVNSSFVNIRSLLAYGDPTRPAQTPAEKADFTAAVLGLVQKMIGAYDMLMHKAMVNRDMYSDLTKERSKLAAFVTRHKHNKFTGTIPRHPSRSANRTDLGDDKASRRDSEPETDLPKRQTEEN